MDYAALPPTLYLIPTPIGAEGPAGALTEQGQAVVRRLRFFAAENVRAARRFLSALEMPVPIDALEIVPFDRESTDEDARELISRLAPGASLGVLSEAGAPGVADPGARLAAMAHSMNVAVCPLVGASSLLLTLMASGLNGQSFAFNGYLPIDQRALRNTIVHLEHTAITTGQTQLFIETPYRNDRLLALLLATLRNTTRLTIARGINTPEQLIRTRTIAEWKATPPPIGKIPTVFAIGSIS